MSLFVEIGLLLALTTLVGVVMKTLKQPQVVGYILSGILAGPYFFNLLQSTQELEVFSKVGIVILLFVVGLHLNPRVIKEVGTISAITGIGQVVFTSLIGFGLALLLGIDLVSAAYVAVALTFSSTIIILKLISDKKDLQKLYAKIAIGFLLVQDIIATFALIAVTVATTQSNQSLAVTLAQTAGVGLVLSLILAVLAIWVLPKVTKYIASSGELLFISSLAWGIGLASLFAWLGFSVEIGALAAGITLAINPYSEEISSRLKPLRDFFITIFFLLLGSQMILSNLSSIVVPAIILSLFVLIGNPIIVIILMNLAGYKKQTGFLAGLTVAQISEFSLILATLGFEVGHISQEVLSLITLVGLLTIAGSTYLILYADQIYHRISGLLSLLEFRKKLPSQKNSQREYTSIIFGFDRVGNHFAKTLLEQEQQFVIVDHNPQAIELLQNSNLPFQFGDAKNIEFLEELPVTKPEIVISTIPDLETNLLITQSMLHRNPQAVVITIAQTVSEAEVLYDAGATYVLLPHYVGAEHTTRLIRRYGNSAKNYPDMRIKSLVRLKKYGLIT